MLQEFFDQVCFELEIEKPNLIISELDPLCGPSHFDSTENKIVINLVEARKAGVDPRIIIAHELRHKWQRDIGLLVVTAESYFRRTVEWKGQIWSVDVSTNEEYRNLPWEVDAIRYETRWARRLDINDRNQGVSLAG